MKCCTMWYESLPKLPDLSGRRKNSRLLFLSPVPPPPLLHTEQFSNLLFLVRQNSLAQENYYLHCYFVQRWACKTKNKIGSDKISQFAYILSHRSTTTSTVLLYQIYIFIFFREKFLNLVPLAIKRFLSFVNYLFCVDKTYQFVFISYVYRITWK